jgi:hypothetical protein
MKILLLSAAALLGLASCSTTRPVPAAEKAAQPEHVAYWQPEPSDTASHKPNWPLQVPPYEAAPDSLPFVNVYQKTKSGRNGLHSFFSNIFHADRTPKPAPAQLAVMPRRCKKCPITINVVQGNQTNTTAEKNAQVLGEGASNTQAGKKAGAIIKADSGATVYNAETKKGQAAAGQGITQEQPASGFNWWWLVVVGVGGYLGYKKFIA